MAQEDEHKLKLYYTTGEVAKMFKINTSTIRFWENSFDILKPRKNKKGNRQFTKEDIDNIRIIYRLVKEEGLTLSGAQAKLNDGSDTTRQKLEVIERLKRIKKSLEDIKNQL